MMRILVKRDDVRSGRKAKVTAGMGVNGLKNTHKNPKFGRVRQIPIRELGWEFPDWDLSHFAKFAIFVGIL